MEKIKLNYWHKGGIIGFILGLLPFLVVWDVLEMEFLIVLQIPLFMISKNMLFIVFGTPIFYAIIGVLIGFIIQRIKNK